MLDAGNFEKLDLFYLGRELDPDTGKPTEIPLLLKSRNLTTHAAIIGMTGSGKTGLGIALLEEAAMDGIPAIVIDPKGDMGNLLLTFPELAPEDFSPWVDPTRAGQQGLSVEELAQQTASTWKEGLQRWGQSGERIRTLREKADFAIYTPGSTTGRPVSVLDSLQAPRADVLEDEETLAGLVNAAVTSLLGLLGIKADPLKSREHILLSSIVLHQWRQGADLTLETLIGMVVSPPFEKVGVFALDTFFPQPRRMELAMQLNNILASPAFAGWTKGEPLDIDAFLFTDSGKPRISIFSIAHLSDAERMFFVTILLGRLISWMRRQEGSSALRCMLYMDEIFGFFPPVANPPSKKPMLLLLKQARAFGVGVVLATQNPVDLDYKGLANIGTWFVGRLQTRQDQDRVMGGLAGSSDHFDPEQVRRLLADMQGRTFLLYSAHRDEVQLFETRWVMSYLRGPLQLSEIEHLVPEYRETGEPAREAVLAAGRKGDFSPTPPLLADGVAQCFVPPPVPMETVSLVPWVAASATVRFFNQRRGIDQTSQICLQTGVDLPIVWEEAEACGVSLEAVHSRAVPGSQYGSLPSDWSRLQNLRSLAREFSDYLYHSQRLELWRCPQLKLESRPGESEAAFRQRLRTVLQEKKEVEVAKVEERYRKKQEQLQDRLARAESRVEKEKSDVRARGIDTALSLGVAVFGALFGRRAVSVTTASRSARGMRAAGRMLRERGDVQRAEEEVARIQEDLAQLAGELQEKLARLSDRFDPEAFVVEPFFIKPRRNDIFNVRVCLLWQPELQFLQEEEEQ